MFGNDVYAAGEQVENWVTIRTLPDRVFVEPVVSLLESNEIPHRVVTDDCGGMDPALTFSYGVEVKVPVSFKATAQTLLAEAFPETTD